jgi:hypothetical protein
MSDTTMVGRWARIAVLTSVAGGMAFAGMGTALADPGHGHADTSSTPAPGDTAPIATDSVDPNQDDGSLMAGFTKSPVGPNKYGGHTPNGPQLPSGNSVTGYGSCTPVADGFADHWEEGHKGHPLSGVATQSMADPVGYGMGYHVDFIRSMACVPNTTLPGKANPGAPAPMHNG